MKTSRWSVWMLSFVCSVLMIGVSINGVYARGFSPIGARATGMGGAGVGLIDNENAGQWNPANLSLTSATRGYTEDYATSFGIGFGAQLLSANNFYQNSKDLVDFYDANQGTGIFQGDYNNNNRDQFIELVALARDLEGDGQGALLNANIGVPNVRHTNWSFGVNNYTDATAYTSLDLTGGLDLDNTAVQNAFGDTSGVSPGTSDYQDVASTCESTFNQGSWNTSDFSLSVNKNQLSNYIAGYAESKNVSPEKTKKFCESGNQILEQSAASVGSPNNSFDTEAQRLIFEGASITEASASYAMPDPVAVIANAPLYVGFTGRIMQGRVAYVEENPFNSSAADSTTEVFDQEDDVKTSTNFGVDVGLTYDARETLGLKIGLVGKYLNAPSFDYPDNKAATDTPAQAPSELTIDPQLRLGVSAYPLDYMPVNVGSDWWQISADYDITKNETLLDNYEKQYLALGNEFNLVNSFWWNLALRVGAKENLAESTEGTLYTGGVGLQMVGLNIEVSGVISDKTTKDEEGNETPTLAGGNFNLSYRF
jgi:hypothetical protein